MNAKDLSQQLVETVFPLLKIEELPEGTNLLPTNASPALQGIWEKLAPVFIEEIKEEEDLQDAKVAIRSRLRRDLRKDDALRQMLSSLVQQVGPTTIHQTHTKIEGSKNALAGNNFQTDGNIHIGDIVNINHPQATAESTPEETSSSLPSSIAQEMRKKITRNKIKAVLEQLLSESLQRDDDLYEQAVHQSQRWNELQKDERLNIITYEQAGTIRSRIVHDTLKIIQELEDL